MLQGFFSWHCYFGQRRYRHIREDALELGRLACHPVDLFNCDFQRTAEARKVADLFDETIDFYDGLDRPFSKRARVSNDCRSPTVLHGSRKDFARGRG